MLLFAPLSRLVQQLSPTAPGRFLEERTSSLDRRLRCVVDEQLRAKKRGLDLPDSVGEFILLRAERNLSTLMRILDELDHRSLQQQRKLTVPLVKETLGW